MLLFRTPVLRPVYDAFKVTLTTDWPWVRTEIELKPGPRFVGPAVSSYCPPTMNRAPLSEWEQRVMTTRKRPQTRGHRGTSTWQLG